MSSLHYVILSDLRLGAGYSLLTDADHNGVARPAKPSPTLAALGTGLRDLVAKLSSADLPTLVLLGDVFDLSFSSAPTALEAFGRFLEQCFPRDETPLFAPQVLYVPGNHDQRVWRMIRDAMLLEDVRLGGTDGINEQEAVTGLFPDTLAPAPLPHLSCTTSPMTPMLPSSPATPTSDITAAIAAW